MKISKFQRLSYYLKNKLFYIKKHFSFRNYKDHNIIYMDQWKKTHRKVS